MGLPSVCTLNRQVEGGTHGGAPQTAQVLPYLYILRIGPLTRSNVAS